MGTIRNEISVRSPYYISKHRYLELKHFCLQYPEWKTELNKINWFGSTGGEIKSTDISKPVDRLYEKRERYLKCIEMVEQSALEADGDIFEWILKSVTEGVSYGYLNVPCSRDYFYDRYRRFFWILDKVREK